MTTEILLVEASAGLTILTAVVPTVVVACVNDLSIGVDICIAPILVRLYEVSFLNLSLLSNNLVYFHIQECFCLRFCYSC